MDDANEEGPGELRVRPDLRRFHGDERDFTYTPPRRPTPTPEGVESRSDTQSVKKAAEEPAVVLPGDDEQS